MEYLKKYSLLVILSIILMTSSFAIKLNSVSYDKVNTGIDVKLNFSGKFKYQIFKIDDPKRVVINLPSTISADKFKKIPVKSNKITEIRYSQFRKNLSRVVVELNEWVRYFPEKKGNDLLLHFQMDNGYEAAKKSNSKKKESKLVDVKLGKNNNKTEVNFKVDKSLNYTIKENELSLNIQFYNTKSFLKKDVFEGDSNIIKKIEIKSLNKKDILAKVDLVKDFPYDVDRSKKELTLVFNDKKTSTKSEITKVENTLKNNKVILKYHLSNWSRYDEKQIGKENKIRLIFNNAVIDKNQYDIPVRKGPVVEINNKKLDDQVVSDIVLKENISYEIYRDNNNVVMEIKSLNEKSSITKNSKNKNVKRGSEVLKDISVQNANITTLLAQIAKVAGYNIVMSKSVSGKVTIDLHNVSWKKALNIILRTNGYDYTIEDNIIRVATLRELKEQVQAKKEKQELMQAGPKEVRIIPISYANPTDITSTLENILSDDASVTVDSRTNSIIITDIKSKIKQAEELINYLDKPTPQVMIKAKFIKVSNDLQRSLGIKWQLNNNAGFEDTNTNSDVTGGSDVIVNPSGTNSGQIVTSLLDAFDLNMKLSMVESESKAEVLASPKITVINNESAHFNVGKKIPISQVDEAGNTVSKLQEIGITLDVTPTINSSNEVLLDIAPEVSDLATPASGADLIISSNTAETKLLVKDGKTAVIGGLLRKDKSASTSGVPLLKDIPILGRLFKNKTRTHNTQEILIFVTPHIIRPNEG